MSKCTNYDSPQFSVKYPRVAMTRPGPIGPCHLPNPPPPKNYHGTKVHVIYSLSDFGESLIPGLQHDWVFIQKHLNFSAVAVEIQAPNTFQNVHAGIQNGAWDVPRIHGIWSNNDTWPMVLDCFWVDKIFHQTCIVLDFTMMGKHNEKKLQDIQRIPLYHDPNLNNGKRFVFPMW